jgi:DNA end-binding protein Ku
MAGTVWKGALAFGLVNIPVELKAAVRADRVSFRLLDADDLAPVKYERVSSSTGDVIPWKQIVKGYEYTKGKFVVLTDDDFRAAALDSSRTIDILDFVPAGEIDWRYFETPYYLLPGRGGDKAYALLREAIRASGSVGIGKIVMRSAQHLAGIRVVGEALVLELMRFANELIDPSEYRFPDASVVRPQELRMAEQLVENLAHAFEPAKYTDDYRENLMRVIRAKLKGKKIEIVDAPDEDDDTQVIDLMSRLKASLEQTPARTTTRTRAARKTSKGPRKRKSA